MNFNAVALGPRAGGVKRGLARGGVSVYREAMLDRLYLPILAAAAAAAVGLALVWPQGLGDRSPAPFGRDPVQRSPAMQAAMKRETEASEARLNNARQAVRDLQTPTVAPTR